MLTKHDEYICHQHVSTFAKVGTSAREWTERVWLTAWDMSGKLSLSTGIGRYLNRNIIDAYGTVDIEDKAQFAVRASRELYPAVDEVIVGPFSYEVIEPLKKVKYILEENEHGLSYELEFDGICPCVEEPIQYAEYKGRIVENRACYIQTGRLSGWLKAEGTTYEITPDTWMGVRDHSWGIRRGGMVPETGVEPQEIPEGYFFNLAFMQFENWGVAYHIRENWEGKPLVCGGEFFYPFGVDKEPERIVKVEHDFHFNPTGQGDPRRAKSGVVKLTGEGGTGKEISLQHVTQCSLAPGGYFGYNGFVHGQWMGEKFLDGLKLDLTDPDTAKDLNQCSILVDQICELRSGSDAGQGMIELVCIGKYPKYGYEGY